MKSALFSTYNRWNIRVAHATGNRITDVSGNEFIDFTSGIAVCNLGHRHEAIQAAIEQQLQKVWHVSNLFENELQEQVASLLAKHSAGDRVFFCNSGAEANEAAIKLARKYTGKHKIVTFQQSFHGRTIAAMSATGQEKIHQGFGPLLKEFVYLPFNDMEALEQVMDDDIAAVMVEAVQGEGGVISAETAFLQKIEELCNRYGALFIVDEVQTGIGRTGTLFAYEQANVSPDIITVAKALGNGIPVGAMVGKEALSSAFGAGSHGSTFGGNMLAMAAAKAVLYTVLQESFLQQVVSKGGYLLKKLQEELSRFSIVKDIRGKGLMIGIECEQEAALLVQKLQEEGLLVLTAGTHVLRLLPPLTVSLQDIDFAVKAIAKVIKEESKVSL
ncbi:acetylornithine transaminase [Bacillus sp. 165]|uniref:acetylornithine transaminase n=1 Tax=Bacillus sp. 165 TaxID=1529117 RepID=UPI001ADB3F53|nr:acetylornithine transaminase [Bacillus sp. 165]MBO9129763.1 acetylornithine transaminase [Bacillus sp. 165]